jgi:hypothetical protein
MHAFRVSVSSGLLSRCIKYSSLSLTRKDMYPILATHFLHPCMTLRRVAWCYIHMTIPAQKHVRVLFDRHKQRSVCGLSFPGSVCYSKPATRLTWCSPSAAAAIILSGSGAALFLHGLSFAIPAYRPLPAHALVIEVVFAFPVLVSYRSSRPTRDHHTETEASLPLGSGESSGGLCCCLSSARCLAHCLFSILTFQKEFSIATGPIISRKQHRNPSHASNNPQARD